jgi:hypothetical protein
MDAARFDHMTRMLGRRGLLGLLLGIAGLGGAAAALPPPASAGPAGDFCAKEQTGERCRNNGECCSGRCKRKKKKGKKGKKKRGKCQCSPLRAPCSDVSDCCIPPAAEGNLAGPVCTRRLGSESDAAVCCMPDSATCSSSEDCCVIFATCSNGHCVSS